MIAVFLTLACSLPLTFDPFKGARLLGLTTAHARWNAIQRGDVRFK